ncbi:MAG: FtsK/SpoIIIE domain-containing protein [Gemmataceae bacterium]
MCPFAEPKSLLFHTQEDGRDQALDDMRAVMMRLLTGMAPGRVRFLIVDPVGLGQSFGAFMNLADFDEKIVGSRIWTEANHIEQRLADLTGHMENVIQKYLRNRYPTIADYNAEAGEVAEPYRVLVVANFPANFTAEAMRRLVSIAQSGPRCGISVIASIDHRQPLPKGFELADIEGAAVNLDWEAGRFRWRDDDFGRHDLTLDAPPDDEFANRILHLVGQGAKAAQRVEVPFEFIAPAAEQQWTGVSRKGLEVPLGRAGATRRQFLELGRGTSQHVLVAGKTGSGKSTLLHALIVNLGLMYSPDEVEVYLVDFKKGVEFKVYTTHDLPHARVVAIESEREFGLSVLQRLDAMIAARGELFRKANVQDLNAYREEVPEARLPRVLLIVDEFQEFFVEDDKLAQEAARLLDRLVRQGRAFGIHVLLGSQTIGGAYSLARSTIDQMAVRIALQCSEADAHLILSDDNSAARLLSRPGEAIYNDANGRVEGNNPFQVVWLGDDLRERYLTRMQELAAQRPTKPRPPMVVFEGNAAADPSKNHLLERLLKSPPSADDAASLAEHAWLGEAMAIYELTSATFRRQNGSNWSSSASRPSRQGHDRHRIGRPGGARHGTSRARSGRFSVPLFQRAARLPRFFVIDGHAGDAPKAGILPGAATQQWSRCEGPGHAELSDVLNGSKAEPGKSTGRAGRRCRPTWCCTACSDGDLRRADRGRLRPDGPRGREAGDSGQATRRSLARRPGAGHSRTGVVRHAEQPQPRLRPAGDA